MRPTDTYKPAVNRRKGLTRQDEAHYVIYRRLSVEGVHDPYALASRVVADLKNAGLTVTKRSGGCDR